MAQAGHVYAITGGTGSLGTALTHHLLAQGHKVRTISRDEHKINALYASVDPKLRDNLSTLVGDVRDRYRLWRAFDRVDFVIHAAAMKHVGRCESDPNEAIETNIKGTMAVANACLDAKVKRAVFISSDKACQPHNLYGMTKATGERLWLAQNRYSAGIGTEFVAVRYGNVWGSNGSVIRKWQGMDRVSVTDPECTRFHLRLSQAIELVLSVLSAGTPGSLYVPLLPSYRLRDLAEAFDAKAKKEVIGLQPGEKLHECMVSEPESRNAVREDGRIRIDPLLKGDGVKEYTSATNSGKRPGTGWYLTVEELRREIEWLKSTTA